MTKDKINFSDLSKIELDELKDLYVSSRLDLMSENDLKLFVKISLEDQIKGTVGNEEEREAWKEMEGHFKEDFVEKIFEIQQKRKDNSDMPIEKSEVEKRMKLLEQRKKEKEKEVEDMW